MFGRFWSKGGGIGKGLSAGDTPCAVKRISTLVTAGAGTIPAASLVGGVIIRTAAGANRVDTTDTAVAIMNALIGNDGNGPEVGESFECVFSQQSAGGWKSTIAGGVGVSLVALSGDILTDTARTLLFVCTAKGTNTFSTSTNLWTNAGATFDVNVL